MNTKTALAVTLAVAALGAGGVRAAGQTGDNRAARPRAGIPAAVSPAGAAFTYQGRLTDAGAPADGLYDIRFILYDADAGGQQVSGILVKDDVAVAQGLFAVTLDFGAGVFAGDARWLEISVRAGSSTGAYSALSPRQELTPAPHAVFAATTPWSGVSGIPSGFADDVDNDTLGGLTCGNSQAARWNQGALRWECKDVLDAHTHDERYYTETEMQTSGAADVHWGNVTHVPSDLADGDDDALAALGCASGEIPVFSGASGDWACGGEEDPRVGVNTKGYVPRWSGSALVSGTIFDDGYSETASPNTPVPLWDNAPPGVTDTINLPDMGTTEEVIVSIHITNSDLTGIRVELYDPDNVMYLLWNKNQGGTELIASYPDPDTPVSGDLTVWAGRNPAGAWRLKVIDSKYLNNASDGRIEDWSVSVLAQDGRVGIGTATPQGKLDVNGSIFQRGAQLHADYVFEPSYEVESIEEHARFMWENKHLRGIPSVRLDEKGREIIEIGAQQKGIVEELEKAHIYIEQLLGRVRNLEERNDALDERLGRLEDRGFETPRQPVAGASGQAP